MSTPAFVHPWTSLTVDPIRDGNNWHAYLGGVADPVNYVDLWGLLNVESATLTNQLVHNGRNDDEWNRYRKQYYDPETNSIREKTDPLDNSYNPVDAYNSAVSSIDGFSGEVHVSFEICGQTAGAGIEYVNAFGSSDSVVHAYGSLPTIENIKGIIKQGIPGQIEEAANYFTPKVTAGASVGPIWGLDGNAYNYKGSFISGTASIPTPWGFNADVGYAQSPNFEVKTLRLGASVGNPGFDLNGQSYKPIYSTEYGFNVKEGNRMANQKGKEQ